MRASLLEEWDVSGVNKTKFHSNAGVKLTPDSGEETDNQYYVSAST